jgi:hypothetical protein
VYAPSLPPPPADFPQARETLRQFFPASDDAMGNAIVAAAVSARPGLGDAELAEALILSHAGKRQQSAALWLKTLPQWLKTHNREPAATSRGAPQSTGEVCPECGGTGEIFNPECERVPNSVWLDWPPERQFLPCPRCRGAPRKPPRTAAKPSAALEVKHG